MLAMLSSVPIRFVLWLFSINRSPRNTRASYGEIVAAMFEEIAVVIRPILVACFRASEIGGVVGRPRSEITALPTDFLGTTKIARWLRPC